MATATIASRIDKSFTSLLVKEGELYVFRWNAATKTQVLRTVGHYAANKDLGFDWDDAAKLSESIRAAG